MLAAAQSTDAEVWARSRRASLAFAPVANEPLWLARPGGAVGPVGVLGLEPTITSLRVLIRRRSRAT